MEQNGFSIFNTFYNLDDLKYYASKHKTLLTDIRTGKINIAILYNGLTPIGVILATKKRKGGKNKTKYGKVKR